MKATVDTSTVASATARTADLGLPPALDAAIDGACIGRKGDVRPVEIVRTSETPKQREITKEEKDLESIDFGVKKSLRYHAIRRRFFETWENITKCLVAFTSAWAFIAILGGENSSITIVLTAAVTILALADIIFGFGRRARMYQDLYRQFSDLAIAIALVLDPTRQDVAQLKARRLRIEADEPPLIDALERWCWNAEAEARHAAPEMLHKLTKWQKLRARLS
jgi:hypothetical protein